MSSPRNPARGIRYTRKTPGPVTYVTSRTERPAQRPGNPTTARRIKTNKSLEERLAWFRISLGCLLEKRLDGARELFLSLRTPRTRRVAGLRHAGYLGASSTQRAIVMERSCLPDPSGEYPPPAPNDCSQLLLLGLAASRQETRDGDETARAPGSKRLLARRPRARAATTRDPGRYTRRYETGARD